MALTTARYHRATRDVFAPRGSSFSSSGGSNRRVPASAPFRSSRRRAKTFCIAGEKRSKCIVKVSSIEGQKNAAMMRSSAVAVAAGAYACGRRTCLITKSSSSARDATITKASSSTGKISNKIQNIPKPYRSIFTLASAMVFVSLIANSDLSIAFPHLAPVQKGCEIVSTNAIKSFLLVMDGALDTAECVWILLNKIRAPQGVIQGLIEMLSGAGALITGTVGTGVSAIGAAVAFVMSRVAMFLATVAVWAGAGTAAFVSSGGSGVQGLPTLVVVAITAGATVLIQNAWRVWKGDGIDISSSNATPEAAKSPPPLKAERVIRSVAQPVVSEVVSTLKTVASIPSPSMPRVVDQESEDVRRVFERLKAEAEANANISNLNNKENADDTKRISSKQRFQAFTYLVKETLDSIKGIANKDADEVLFDAKFQVKEVASITSKTLDETFSDKEQFEESLKRMLKKTTNIANETVITTAPMFKKLSPVLSKSAKRAARELRKIDVSQTSYVSDETKSDLPKVETPAMPKIEMPKMEMPMLQNEREEKKEEPPKLSTTAIEEKDTRSIENAKKEAAEKVLNEMAALEAQMSRFSTGSDESIDSPKSGAEGKSKISVPDVELPPGTKVIRDSEDDGDGTRK